METKPDWIPKWVWAEYLAYVRKWSRWANLPGDVSTSGKMMLDAGRAVVFDKGCGSIWPAMERRSRAALEMWKARQTDCPGGVRWGNPNQVHGLFTEVAFALRGPAPDELIPGRDRKKRGERIARLASDLRRELAALSNGEFLPRMFLECYVFLSNDIKNVIRNNYARTVEMMSGCVLDELQLDEIGTAARDGFLMGIMGQFQALMAIEQAAAAWSQSDPVVYRPNDSGMQRLYFMRRMTAFFKLNYDTPLREVNAALTRCFFDCDIDAATVAKLAP